MKRIFKHPAAPATGKKYWRSLEEFADTPAFREKLAQEFPRGAAELEGDELTRRSFMKFMGASVALAGIGLTGCRRPELHAVPYTKGVEWQVPGNALHYATSMPRRGGALPLIATTYNGRPTKLDGNPNVPGFNGATDIFGQAAILDLYDPDRSQVVLKVAPPIVIMTSAGTTDMQDSGKSQEVVSSAPVEMRGKDYLEATIEDFWEELAIVRNAYQKTGGDGLAILAEPCSSPTRERLRGELAKQFPKLVWSEYEPWTHQAGTAPVYDFSKADVIVSLDCDFLGASDGTPQSIAQFAAGRRKLGKTQETMSRLYAIEGRLSLTGSMADHRLRVPSSSIGGIVTLLASKLGNGLPTGNSFAAFNDPKVDAWVTAMAADLQKAGARGLVVAGAMQPASVHAAVASINAALNVPVSRVALLTSASTSLSDLAETISQGTIKTLIVLGGNPVFTAPTELGLDGVIAQVEQVIRVGLHVDETSAVATSHVPMKHYLEAWGDNLAWNSTYLSQQPLIEPLYPSVSEIELIAFLAGLPSNKGFDLVQQTFNKGFDLVRQTFDAGYQVTIDHTSPSSGQDNGWRQFVHDGFSDGAGSTLVTLAGQTGTAQPRKQPAPAKPLGPDDYELVFFLGNIDDGRYANNGWLQELPDTISKLTWDNAILMSPNTATKLGVNVMPPNGSDADLPDTDFNPRSTDHTLISPIAIDPTTAFPMVKVTTPDGRTAELPVLVVPGQHDQTLSLALGWGRTAPRLTKAQRDVVTPPLRIADGAGFNAYNLRTAATPGFVTVKVEKIEKTYPLAMTQEHNSMEGRGLVREATLEKFHDDPAFVQEIGEDKDIPQGDLTGYQKFESGYIPPSLNSAYYQADRPAWGMVIDLNSCVGCNTCTIACQAENNIPVVGKFQVIRGREMAWIRIDRYFGTDVSAGNPTDSKYLEDPQVLFQPMACQQCELAPCEPVCPVNATVHNEEGLNVMAYNRCIGTRYCANNCPYKVRRFNFFSYNERPISTVKLPVLGQVGELYLGPLAGRDGPLTYKGSPESLILQKNPNVTVRMRGVMEKCTYCVQRIEEAKITQLRKSNEMGAGSGDITLPTDSFKVACQQACPAEAITFGNLNDPQSRVSILKQDERNYGVLAYLGTRPRTSYLGRVRNPNMLMPGAGHIGHTSEFEEESKGPEKNGADKPDKPENVKSNTDDHAQLDPRGGALTT
jgi:molybdopterin-containing oxidoreductase family iron-sulfur binding subunit